MPIAGRTGPSRTRGRCGLKLERPCRRASSRPAAAGFQRVQGGAPLTGMDGLIAPQQGARASLPLPRAGNRRALWSPSEEKRRPVIQLLAPRGKRRLRLVVGFVDKLAHGYVDLAVRLVGIVLWDASRSWPRRERPGAAARKRAARALPPCRNASPSAGRCRWRDRDRPRRPSKSR